MDTKTDLPHFEIGASEPRKGGLAERYGGDPGWDLWDRWLVDSLRPSAFQSNDSIFSVYGELLRQWAESHPLREKAWEEATLRGFPMLNVDAQEYRIDLEGMPESFERSTIWKDLEKKSDREAFKLILWNGTKEFLHNIPFSFKLIEMCHYRDDHMPWFDTEGTAMITVSFAKRMRIIPRVLIASAIRGTDIEMKECGVSVLPEYKHLVRMVGENLGFSRSGIIEMVGCSVRSLPASWTERWLSGIEPSKEAKRSGANCFALPASSAAGADSIEAGPLVAVQIVRTSSSPNAHIDKCDLHAASEKVNAWSYHNICSPFAGADCKFIIVGDSFRSPSSACGVSGSCYFRPGGVSIRMVRDDRDGFRSPDSLDW